MKPCKKGLFSQVKRDCEEVNLARRSFGWLFGEIFASEKAGKIGEGFADSLLCKGSVHSTLHTKAEPRPTITLWLMVVDSDEFPGNPLNAYDIAVMLH